MRGSGTGGTHASRDDTACRAPPGTLCTILGLARRCIPRTSACQSQRVPLLSGLPPQLLRHEQLAGQYGPHMPAVHAQGHCERCPVLCYHMLPVASASPFPLTFHGVCGLQPAHGTALRRHAFRRTLPRQTRTAERVQARQYLRAGACPCQCRSLVEGYFGPSPPEPERLHRAQVLPGRTEWWQAALTCGCACCCEHTAHCDSLITSASSSTIRRVEMFGLPTNCLFSSWVDLGSRTP